MRELVSNGAVVTHCNEEIVTAVHMAAFWSSCTVVAMLVEAKSSIDLLDDKQDTPLSWCCCHRDDDEAVKIAQLLFNYGARLELCGDFQRTIDCMFAGFSGSSRVAPVA